ncbi:MAG: hypothetical protein JNJ77_01045 [Planctomycetia bacterium]|nr:hypothetical protein [Planctomycetia bacterium]
MAMFVMAIGMISLLALFPVGFLNARWALDAEQVSRGAANAQAMTEMPRAAVDNSSGFPVVSQTQQSIRNDDNYHPEGATAWQGLPNLSTTPFGRDVFLKDGTRWTFMWRNINGSLPGMPGAKFKLPPVFVDPFVAFNPLLKDTAVTNLPFHIGVNRVDDPGRIFVPFAHNANALPVLASSFRPAWSVGIPRLSLSQYQRDLGAVKLRLQTETSMGDEIDFASNGQPNVIAGQFGAQRRFTWGYMCHWYDYNMPNVCDVSAVIFNSRPDVPSQFPVGEDSYSSNPDVLTLEPFGRLFVKGLNQAIIPLPTPEPMKAKVGDWILDNTFILPDYDSAYPNEVMPFLDQFDPAWTYTYVVSAQLPVVSGNPLRPGLCGGHFYKILDISSVRSTPSGMFFQTITLDRPARSDGFTACLMQGIADVIVKGVGQLPQR